MRDLSSIQHTSHFGFAARCAMEDEMDRTYGGSPFFKSHRRVREITLKRSLVMSYYPEPHLKMKEPHQLTLTAGMKITDVILSKRCFTGVLQQGLLYCSVDIGDTIENENNAFVITDPTPW